MLRSVGSARVKKLNRCFMQQNVGKQDSFGVMQESFVRQAVNAGIVTEILYVSDCPIPFEKKTQVTPEVMEFITFGKETSIAAICRRTKVPLPSGDMHRILMLDHVIFPTNIGRIFYVAYSFGIDAIYVSEEDDMDYYKWKITESSHGTSFYLPVIPTSLPEKVRELREQGFYCVGTSLHDAVPLSEVPSADKMVFVVGNERDGVSEEVLRETDVRCRIEMENYDSLNVSIATGIVLYHFRR